MKNTRPIEDTSGSTSCEPTARMNVLCPHKQPNIPFRDILQKRMELFGYDKWSLAQKSYADIKTINGLLDGSIIPEDADELDLARICNALSTDMDVMQGLREDMLSHITQHDTAVSVRAKARIQRFASDYAFLQETIAEP